MKVKNNTGKSYEDYIKIGLTFSVIANIPESYKDNHHKKNLKIIVDDDEKEFPICIEREQIFLKQIIIINFYIFLIIYFIKIVI